MWGMVRSAWCVESAGDGRNDRCTATILTPVPGTFVADRYSIPNLNFKFLGQGRNKCLLCASPIHRHADFLGV